MKALLVMRVPVDVDVEQLRAIVQRVGPAGKAGLRMEVENMLDAATPDDTHIVRCGTVQLSVDAHAE